MFSDADAKSDVLDKTFNGENYDKCILFCV